MLGIIKNNILIWLIFALHIVYAKAIDISEVNNFSILEHSKVYFSDTNANIHEVINNKDKFVPYNKSDINLGSSFKTIWISFELKNQSQKPIDKILVISSPLLNHIVLHNEANIHNNTLKGIFNLKENRSTLYPYFDMHIEAGVSNRYLLEIRSATNPIHFGVELYDKEIYYTEDRRQQFIYTLLVGILIALMLHNFFQFFYMKEKSYLYYSFYLFALIYQQIGYLGLSQIYFPHYFLSLDIQKSVFKVDFLIITAALFSIHFLKIKEIPLLYRIYQLFIFVSIIEILVLNGTLYYNLDIVVTTGTLFIIFNIYSGYMSYIQGNKQARLFIVGFSIVGTIYLIMSLDALGITSIIFEYKYLLILMTTLEALILSLAFSDKYIILQEEKQKSDALLLANSKNRTKIIEMEVNKKTQELKAMIDTKELLINEIHHRVKNNLQIMLSMIRMQNDTIETRADKTQLTCLENRINAIAKSYDMLIIKDNLEEIDLSEYIDALLRDIQSTYANSDYQVSIHTNITVMLPLREAIYIGLILNEMVTNSYKYAFSSDGNIYITLQKKKNNYILEYKDDGCGYSLDNKNDSLGLKLIHQLVYNQLNGSMEIDSHGHTHYYIRF